MFPYNQQDQVRAQLSFVIQGIVSQQLIPKKYGGRVVASEIMVPNAAIRNLIRENKLQQIYSTMQSGQKEHKMQTMTQDLVRLVTNDIISMDEALMLCTNHEEFQMLLAKGERTPKK